VRVCFVILCEQGLRCLSLTRGTFWIRPQCSTITFDPRLVSNILETGEFRLVAESTYERNLLLRQRATLLPTRPLPTIIPIYFLGTNGIWSRHPHFFGFQNGTAKPGPLFLIKID